MKHCSLLSLEFPRTRDWAVTSPSVRNMIITNQASITRTARNVVTQPRVSVIRIWKSANILANYWGQKKHFDIMWILQDFHLWSSFAWTTGFQCKFVLKFSMHHFLLWKGSSGQGISCASELFDINDMSLNYSCVVLTIESMLEPSVMQYDMRIVWTFSQQQSH